MKTDKDNFYVELVSCLHLNSATTIMEWMAAHGQSLTLSYGEDNHIWECTWITSGKRFVAMDKSPTGALKSVLTNVRAELLFCVKW